MSGLAPVQHPHIHFNVETFITKDSKEGIDLCETFLKNHPEFNVVDRDRTGRTLAEYAISCSNVSLLNHVLSKNPSISINNTIFGTMLIYLTRAESGSVEKEVECVQIAIDEGTNLEGVEKNQDVQEYIIEGEPDLSSRPDQIDNIHKYCVPLVKTLLFAGVKYDGEPDDMRDLGKCQIVNKAKEEMLDWNKTRLFYVGRSQQQGNTFNDFPNEIIEKIVAIKARLNMVVSDETVKAS